MPKKHIVVVAFIAVVLGIAGWFFYDWYSSQQKTERLEMSGNVDIREVNLAFRISGRVQSVLVDEGDVIGQSGQLLAVIDEQPLRNTLNEAKANLAAAQAALDMMVAGYRQEDIAQAQAQLRAQQAQLVNAQRMFARQQSLAGTGAVPSSAMDDARAARDLAAAQVEAARQNYELLNSGYRPQEVEQARAQVALAQARVDAAQLQLDDAQLKAVGTGVIITRAVEPGSMVSAGTPVLTLSLNDPVWVRAYVQEPDLGRVASGTPVKIYTDGADKKVYDGQIGFVSPTAEFTPKQVQTQDLRTAWMYRLRVVVTNPDDGLRQGMPVVVRLASDVAD